MSDGPAQPQSPSSPPSPSTLAPEQRRERLLAALSGDDNGDASYHGSSTDQPGAQLADLVVNQWEAVRATFEPPAHPAHDIHLAPAIWALRRLKPSLLRFLAGCLHQEELDSLDKKTADRLRRLAQSLHQPEEVLLFFFGSHRSDFLSDTVCRALRVLAKNHNFDLGHLLERIQARFDDEVRAQSPECRENRFALKLTREAVADIDPAAWKGRGHSKSLAHANSPASTARSARSPSPAESELSPVDHHPLPPALPDRATTPAQQPDDSFEMGFGSQASGQMGDFTMEDSTIVVSDPQTPSLPSPSPLHKKRRIHAISDSAESKVGVRSATSSLLQAQLQCLDVGDQRSRRDKYLNDSVVNEAVAKLLDWFMGPVGKRPALAIDSLLQSSKLVSKRRRERMAAEFNRHQVLYLPTNDAERKHWMLFRAIRPPYGCSGANWALERYDSLGAGEDDNDDKVRTFLSEYGIKCGAATVVDCAQQPNTFDCGVYVVAFVECLLQNIPVDFPPFDSIQARTKLRHNLEQCETAPLALLVTPDRMEISLEYAKHQAALREPAGFGLSLELLRLVRRNERDMTEAHMRIWYLVWFQEGMQAALAMAEQVPLRPQETTLEKRARLMGEIMDTFSPDALATADDSGDTEILHDMGQSMAKVIRLKFKITPPHDRTQMHEQALQRAVFVVLSKVSQQKLARAAMALRDKSLYVTNFPVSTGASL